MLDVKFGVLIIINTVIMYNMKNYDIPFDICYKQD